MYTLMYIIQACIQDSFFQELNRDCSSNAGLSTTTKFDKGLDDRVK